ncbi:hypothetical protein D3C73_1593880 [compost metagenome]
MLCLNIIVTLWLDSPVLALGTGPGPLLHFGLISQRVLVYIKHLSAANIDNLEPAVAGVVKVPLLEGIPFLIWGTD